MTRGLAVGAGALILTALGGILVAVDASPAATAAVSGLALGPALGPRLALFVDRMTFVLSPVLIAALALSSVAIWQITGDGRAMPFEGWALVALYVVLATLAWFE
jgi:hypothetical protein